ncbi:hypothetical protein [Methylosinus sp. Sm6]|uniref:hypothetical protein n=1 Tax=Methylosinus sp. Sm6 TaxID=2866948 RepID=UPI001C9925D8|nr:hypothetical protein [Methylosinus sp. Sm6]
MSWPAPCPGLVIRYSYLWEREAREGREEGVKDRPCAVVVVLAGEAGEAPLVGVLPITHTPPVDATEAVEIPAITKQRLGLDSERSWIVLTETNDFVWPGPDLRPAVNGDLSSIVYGMLPPRFFAHVREKVVSMHRLRRLRRVARTE